MVGGRVSGRETECTCANARMYEFSALGSQKKLLDFPHFPPPVAGTPGGVNSQTRVLGIAFWAFGGAGSALNLQQARSPCHPLPSMCPLRPLLSVLDGLAVLFNSLIH